ncbi:hypothetical protein MUO14_24050 [Halobacillus shinanisalinarum]|uniref:Uncharacterized protein n=1 Tax=Halobacillus shinanisalinarum TaxID=2932258 RepID=A0ABY4GZR5_9BACI|nr:hypothetical protein [Halobacillus shinanisalinarum]UOQ93405.1 hypothetical protein MUO14_24050 [Halobacillus shinanisalinarum]
MADNKSREESRRSIDKPSMTKEPPRQPVTPKKKSVDKLTVDVDCSDALKGLKAVQREAKKATAALKELDNYKPIGPGVTWIPMGEPEAVIPTKNTQSYHCTKQDCDWEIKDTKKTLDGISCPECGSHTVMPYPKPKLLTIELDSIDSVPTVIYKGEKIDNKVFVEFNWETQTNQPTSSPLIDIQYHEISENGAPSLRTIGHSSSWGSDGG